MKKILSITLATIWISISEFFRNENLLKDNWITHFSKLGIDFPSDPINGAIWGLWSLMFAVVIYFLNKKFNFWETVLLAWFIGFILMWTVIGNLFVLPYSILPFAIPLSFLETLGAIYIIKKMES